MIDEIVVYPRQHNDWVPEVYAAVKRFCKEVGFGYYKQVIPDFNDVVSDQANGVWNRREKEGRSSLISFCDDIEHGRSEPFIMLKWDTEGVCYEVRIRGKIKVELWQMIGQLLLVDHKIEWREVRVHYQNKYLHMGERHYRESFLGDGERALIRQLWGMLR